MRKALFVNCRVCRDLMVRGVVFLQGIVNRFYHAEGHTDSDDVQCEPKTPVE